MDDGPVVPGLTETRPQELEAAVADCDDLIIERVRGRGTLSERMLDFLCVNKVVALYQGRSEFGPRALGVPVLLNTSFNGKDEAIVETPREALAAFRRMPLHALAMPPFWIRKRIGPELPE